MKKLFILTLSLFLSTPELYSTQTQTPAPAVTETPTQPVPAPEIKPESKPEQAPVSAPAESKSWYDTIMDYITSLKKSIFG